MAQHSRVSSNIMRPASGGYSYDELRCNCLKHSKRAVKKNIRTAQHFLKPSAAHGLREDEREHRREKPYGLPRGDVLALRVEELRQDAHLGTPARQKG